MLADLVQTELKILEQPEGQSGEGESYGEGSGSAKQGGNIVLMGLSQGCASILTAILALRGEPSMEKVAAVVGMCGWLPLEHELQNVMRNEENDELDSAAYDIDARRFAATVAAEQCDQAQVPKYHLLAPVTGYLKRALGLALSEYSTFATAPPPPPIFIGHGAKDTKVPTARGREAAECLSTIVGVGNAESSGAVAPNDAAASENVVGGTSDDKKAEVVWKEYADLDHWYSGKMLADIVLFLRGRLNLKADE
jgi:hypothetical protein